MCHWDNNVSLHIMLIKVERSNTISRVSPGTGILSAGLIFYCCGHVDTHTVTLSYVTYLTSYMCGCTLIFYVHINSCISFSVSESLSYYLGQHTGNPYRFLYLPWMTHGKTLTLKNEREGECVKQEEEAAEHISTKENTRGFSSKYPRTRHYYCNLITLERNRNKNPHFSFFTGFFSLPS